MNKTIRFVEIRGNEFFAKTYVIYVNDDEWYRGVDPPEWFFWVGMFQQYGRYEVEVVHEVVG